MITPFFRRPARQRSALGARRLHPLIKIFIVVNVILGLVSYTVMAERRISAAIQDRIGPNRVGLPLGGVNILGLFTLPKWTWWGLGQPLADALKFMLKEEFTPAGVNKLYFWLAPAMAMVPALLTICVIPFGSSHADHAALGLRHEIARRHRRRRHRRAPGLRHLLAQRLRHRPRRLVLQLEVPVPRRHPLQRADDLLRSLHGPLRHPHLSRHGQPAPLRCRAISGRSRLDRPALFSRRGIGKLQLRPLDSHARLVPHLSRLRFCRDQPPSRSTCPKAKRNSSAATTPNIRR